jgi:hypothetical protein
MIKDVPLGRQSVRQSLAGSAFRGGASEQDEIVARASSPCVDGQFTARMAVPRIAA